MAMTLVLILLGKLSCGYIVAGGLALICFI